MTQRLYERLKVPFSLYEMKVIQASDAQLLDISRELAIGLNLHEMKKVEVYFKQKGRNPTDVELQTIGQTWSEHCFHKTFKGNIHFEDKEIHSLFKTYIAKAT